MVKFVEGFSRNEIAVGTTFGIRHGSNVDLPDVGPRKRWVQFDHNEMGRMYVVEEVHVETEPNWKEMYQDLSSAMKETDKIISENKEAAINPEYVETENLHKERMRLENEELELNNKAKRNALTKEVTEHNDNQRLNAYAQQVRDQQAEIIKLRNQLVAKDCEADYVDYSVRHSPISAKFHTDRLYKNAIWLWGVIVAFGINEVIQWLTR